jgi:hypothetical protein
MSWSWVRDSAAAHILEQTIIGQRRVLADLIRLQLYGVLWAATGIDQYYPEDYRPAQRDLAPDEGYYNFAAHRRI